MGKSLKEQVYETIKQDIISCVFPPGQQIAQPQLAERYNTGITPIREALQKLAQEGLVEPIPRFGYLVTPITWADVREIFELRSILESAAARLAATRATDEQLRHLSELANYTYVYQDRDSYADFLAHNRDFHLAVAEASGNRRLVDSISQCVSELTRVFHLGLDLRDSAEEMRAEHQELVAALHNKDTDKAGQIVLAQISHSQQRILDALQGSSGAEGGGKFGMIGKNIQLSNH